MSDSLPDRLERVGIVVGSAVVLALPAVPAVGAVADLSGAALAVAVLLPGTAVGLAVAYHPRVSVEYGQVWRFGLVSWLALLALESLSHEPAVWTEALSFLLAFALGLVVAGYDWWIPRIRRAVG